jgi:acyl carrier protein
MDESQIRAGVLASLCEVAPEVESDQLSATRPLRQQVDLDSMDWLNVIIGWHRRFGVEIPEADYARLTTLDAVVAYIGAHLEPRTR